MPIEVRSKPSAILQLRETCHDMRQPLATTLALAAAALAERDLPAAVRDRLEGIVDQAELLASMIHECLPPREREEPADEKESGHGLADVVQVAADVITSECLTWPGDLTLEASAEPAWCMLHPGLLRRIIANVVGNATRAAGPKGRVNVEILMRDQAVVLAVEDDGPGFGTMQSGTGLGLPEVARSVVKAGGKLEFSCSARGGSLWLP